MAITTQSKGDFLLGFVDTLAKTPEKLTYEELYIVASLTDISMADMCIWLEECLSTDKVWHMELQRLVKDWKQEA